MRPTKAKLIGSLIIAVSALLAVLGYLFLPDVMTVQIGFNGKSSGTLPKLQAVLLPFAISTLSAVLYLAREERRSKNLILAVVGILMAVFGFVVNYGK